MLASKDGNPVTVGGSPPAGVVRRVSYITIPSLLTVMYVYAMYDDVGGIMNGNAWPPGNVNTRTPTIDRLERVHDQLLPQLNYHVSLENNPQWLILNHSVPESSWLGVHRIIIIRVGDNINPTISTTNGVLAKPNSTISKTLAIPLPIGVTPPAIIYRISSST